MENNTINQPENLIKGYCLEKALKAYQYSQKIDVLELAKQFEQYLSVVHSVDNIPNTP